jgi:hypothetical protein
MVSEQDMQSLVDHEFPGGTFTIEPWENTLLSDVMCVEPPAGGIAHPAYLFHAPLAGVGMRIADMFELFKAESDEAVRAGEYHWEIREPMRVGRTYRMSGRVVSVERKESRKLGFMDVTGFQIDVHDVETGSFVASTTSTWLVLRGSGG